MSDTTSTQVPNDSYIKDQTISESSDPTITYPGYLMNVFQWCKVRDCIAGEHIIKMKSEKYLPRPAGMSGEYASAYIMYLERAHFPQICSYVLQGSLGVIVSKLPEFNLPPELEYLKETATKEGGSLNQLFVDSMIEVLTTGRCPIILDVVPNINQFRFIKYTAEAFTNFKKSKVWASKNLIMATIREDLPKTFDLFSHEYEQVYRVLYLEDGVYTARLYGEQGEYEEFASQPSFLGKTMNEIPFFLAGSVDNSADPQPIPLLSVANCSVQIYRKEADLSNSEYLSCNPTLVISGVPNEADLPNVVGSSVLMNLPDVGARAYYTKTDTAALTHVKNHIDDLYDEAIRHGVSILDTRKGIESPEALRIRQASQSASVFSIYLSVLNAIKAGLIYACEWGGYDKSKVQIDAPSSLTFGIPDSGVIKEIIEGLGKNFVPLSAIHKYLVVSGLLDQQVSLDEYVNGLKSQKKLLSEDIIPIPPAPPTPAKPPVPAGASGEGTGTGNGGGNNLDIGKGNNLDVGKNGDGNGNAPKGAGK